MNDAVLNIIIKATDKASSTATNVSGAFGTASKKLDNVGKSAVDAGMKVSKRLTLPIVGFGALSLKTAGDFEAGMKSVGAVSGATGGELQKLEDLAKNLGSTTQFSASQAADAMGFLAMAGFNTNDIMSALPGTLDLAAASGLDLATSADIASNVLSGYGMEAKELGKANDVMVKTMTRANVDLRMLGESFKFAGPVAKSAGVSFEETSAAIGLMGNAGIQGTMAGTSLRGAISRLLNPTKEASDALSALGVSATDSKGDLLPLEDIVRQLEKSGASTSDMLTIFGDRAGPAMQTLVEQGADSLVGLTKELENSGGIAGDIAATKMEGFNGAIKTLQSAFEGLQIAIADSGMLEFAAGLINKLAGFLQNLSKTNPAMMRMATIIGLVAAAIGPALIAFGFMARGMAMAMKGASALAKGIGFLAKAVGLAAKAIFTSLTFLAAHPVIAIIIGVVLLIAGLVYVIIRNWDTLKGWFSAFWNTILGIVQAAIDFMRPVIDVFVTIFTTAFNAVMAVAKVVFNIIKFVAQVVFVAIMGIVIVHLKIIEAVFKVFLAVVKAIWNAIKAPVLAVFKFIANIVRTYINISMAIIRGVVRVVSSVFRTAFNIVRSIWSGITGVFSGIVNAIGSVIGRVVGVIKAPFRTAFNAIAGLWNNSIGSLSFKAPSWVPGIGGKGFEMPRLPMLAEGALIKKPTIALVGEGGEDEAVLPISRLEAIIDRALEMKSGGGGGDQITNRRDVHIGQVVLQNAEAAREFFRQLDNDTILTNKGLTPLRGDTIVP